MSSLLCPHCNGPIRWKDGLRTLKDGSHIQRYKCGVCGRRVSFPQTINSTPVNGEVQIGANRTVKNLHVPRRKHLGTRELTEEEKAAIKVFEAYLEKQGYHESRYPNNLKTLLYLGADLNDPESVKNALAAHPIKDSAKLQYVYAYETYLRMKGQSWTRPRYKQGESIPFIPEERELDQLIAAAQSKRMAAYLQTLKETFADPGEALRIEWRDINGNVIAINHPVKGHRPRALEVSNKLISMLNCLPRVSDRVFPTTYHTICDCYLDVRKRVAAVTKNERINYIELRTFRHWGGTKIAELTNGNVLTVMRLLGHKRVENSMKYINIYMLKFRTETNYDVITASTPDEIKDAIAAGFEYVCEKMGLMFFRRLKRYPISGATSSELTPQSPNHTRKADIINLNQYGGGDNSRAPLSPSFSTVFISLLVIYGYLLEASKNE